MQEIKVFLENYNLQLISNNYKNSKSILDIRCSCGDIMKVSISNIKRNKYKICEKCIQEMKRVQSFNDSVNYVLNNTELEFLSSLSDFETIRSRLLFKCKCNEIFECSIAQIRNSKKEYCNECSSKVSAEKRRNTIQDIMYEISNAGCTLISTDYKNTSSILSIRCACGNNFKTTLDIFRNGKNRCRDCVLQDRIIVNKYQYDEVVEYIRNKGLTILTKESDYLNAQQKIKIMCNCDNPFEITFSEFKTRKSPKCPSCQPQTLITYLEVKEFIERYSRCEIVTEEKDYKDTKSAIKVRCHCGIIFETNYKSFRISTKQCNGCSKNSMTVKDFKDLFKNNIGKNECELILYESDNGFIRNSDKVDLKCKCGTHFSTTKQSFVDSNVNRCIVCRRVISKGELEIQNYLDRSQIYNQAQYRFSDCRGSKFPLPFDFAIINNENIIIALVEYDGEQHFYPIEVFGGQEGFEKTRRNDAIKNKYCEDNNIPLLRIPYWEFDNIESILTEYLSKFTLISK